MEIALPSLQDFTEIQVLARQIHSLHVDLRPDIFPPMQEPLPQEVFCRLLQEDCIRICRQKGAILGYITWLIQPRPQNGPRLWVEALCVRQDATGQGIGARLMEEACKQGRALGRGAAALTVCENNLPALKFYQSFGMKPENIRYSMPL